MDTLNNTPDFEKIISDTDANMFLKNYQDLYQEALLLKPGIILEIGPARGTGTIVLGLAAKQNPNIEKIITIDAFQNSRALKSFDNVEENISDLRNNLKKFDCEKNITIMVAGREDMELIRNSRISMLVIDADGALDRDFSNYFNLLIPGAIVFVDDCALKLNSHAKSQNTRERTIPSEDPAEDSREYVNKIAPLEKEYITKCFIEYMIRNGFLEQKSIFKSTVTLRKKPDAPAFTDTDRKNMEKIRESMRQMLIEIRKNTLNYVKTAEPILLQICKYTGYNEAVILKGELLKNQKEIRYYPFYVVRTDRKKGKPVSKQFENEIVKHNDPNCKYFFFKTGVKPAEKHVLMLRSDEHSNIKKKNFPLLLKFRLLNCIRNIEKETALYLDSIELPLFL